MTDQNNLQHLYRMAVRNGYDRTFEEWNNAPVMRVIDVKDTPYGKITSTITMTPESKIPPLPPTPPPPSPIILKVETPEERKVVEERSEFFKSIEEPILKRSERIRQELGIPHNVSIARVLSLPNNDLNENELKFKQKYCQEVRLLPNNKQHQKLQDMIDNNIFPLPIHPCKYCLCGINMTMSKLLQETLGCTSTALVKVKDYIQYRWQAIYKHPENYTYIEYDDIDKNI